MSATHAQSATSSAASAAIAERSRLIRLIHVGRRDLQMADDAYRSIVAGVAEGKTSAADCNNLELRRVLDHLKRAGFKVRRSQPAARHGERTLDTSPEATKVRALWLLLHRIGVVRDPSEAALAAYVHRMVKVDAMQWARRTGRMDTIIEGLKAWAARKLPDVIRQRLTALQTAGIVDRRNTYGALLHMSSPRLDPETFDALWAAWDALDEIEERAKQRSAP